MENKTKDAESLRSLVNQASEIEGMLIESSGEITPQIDAAIKAVDLRLPEKVDGYAMVMARMESVADFYSGRAELFIKLAKAAKGINTRCKENLRFSMDAMKVTELNGHDVRWKLVNSKASVIIEDESEIDAAYKIVTEIVTVDKAKILADLKLDVPVEGAKMQENKSLRQYAQKVGKK